MIARRSLLAVLAFAACGDGVERDELFTATSGTRLALQQLRYDDGTEQATTEELYDTELHVRCTPQRWIDDQIRCVPLVEDAVYIDAACTMLVGRARVNPEPGHFLAYDGETPARIFRAGAAIEEPLTAYYEVRDGECTGPRIPPEEDVTYFAVDELDGSSLVPIADGELGQGRLGLRVRESADGVRLPLGLHDRELATACRPARTAGGSFVCAPTTAVPALFFLDPACREPLVAIADEATPPAIASIVEPSGCTGYRAVAGELANPAVYRRDGTACVATSAPVDARLFATGAALELAPIERTLEDSPDHRLQRILLEVGGLRFPDDRLYDTATRADCRRLDIGDVPRCMPEAIASMRTLFAPGCALAVPVADVPQPTCEPVAFARTEITTIEEFEIRALGDRPAGALFLIENGQCLPYPSTAEPSLRSLGPPIDPGAFLGAIYFGAR